MTVVVILVLEGAARAAGPRIAERARVAAQAAPGSADAWPGEGDGGTVQVVVRAGLRRRRNRPAGQVPAGRCIVVHGRPGTAPPLPGRRGPGGRAVLAVCLVVTWIPRGALGGGRAGSVGLRVPEAHPQPKMLMVALIVLVVLLLALCGGRDRPQYEGQKAGPPAPSGRRAPGGGRGRR